SLQGNVDSASEKLSEYSFLLLTSKSEGMSLVIIEAMAQSCVPNSYNLRYGPTDISDDGVNGFLSPSGTLTLWPARSASLWNCRTRSRCGCGTMRKRPPKPIRRQQT